VKPDRIQTTPDSRSDSVASTGVELVLSQGEAHATIETTACKSSMTSCGVQRLMVVRLQL
jgi:hypothetical protein